MLKTTLMKLVKYLPVLVNILEDDTISSSKCKSIRKDRNKKVEILTILKIRNLPKSKSGNSI